MRSTTLAAAALAVSASFAGLTVGGSAPARAATAPSWCSTPMVFEGMDASFTQHLFYRAGCSATAKPLNSVSPSTGDWPVLMPDGGHVASIGIGSNQDPSVNSASAGLEITDIATDTSTSVAQPGSGPTIGADKHGLSAAPDGSALAFEVGNANMAYDGIFVQPLNGSPAYRVSPEATLANGYPVPGAFTAWSHDGTYIAYPVGGGIAWSRSDGSGQAGVVTISGASQYMGLAWTPDDKGLLTWDFGDHSGNPVTGHLIYVDLASGTATTVLTERPGQYIASVSVDQHWNVFMTTLPGGTGTVAAGMDAAWLGNPGTIATLPNAYTDSTGGNIPDYGSWGPSVSMAGPADPPPPGWPPSGSTSPSPTPTSSTPAPSPTPTPTASFVVQIDDSNVGKVFGSLTGKKVLDSEVLPPSQACRSGWEVATTNNTAFVLQTPTNGNVTGTRVDVGQSDSSYLFPGQTAYYCVAFTQLNQVFDVLYDMSDPLARTADAAMLVAEALTPIPAGDAIDLANFVSSVASIPQLQKIGACLGSLNPLCAPRAINALMTNNRSLKELVGAFVDYLKALGESVAQTALENHLHDKKWLEKYLGEKIVKVITTGWWVTKFTGQVILSPTGYVAFETAPSSQ